MYVPPSSHHLSLSLSSWTRADPQFTAASFLPLLKKGGDNTKDYASQIINTTSISGLLKGSSGGQFAYAASKQSMVQVCYLPYQLKLPAD
jgi:NAD(P)-dependent dehydrogenase (short-subunit alcohol dehydrogenase family)